jgi:hypothetical protein
MKPCPPHSDKLRDLIYNAMLETVSGISSLHMAPEPRKHGEDEFYLSEIEGNVYHAVEHFRHVVDVLGKALQSLHS